MCNKISEDLKEMLLNDIEYFYEKAVTIRRHVHKYPELSGKEENTIKYISEILTKHDIVHQVLEGGAGIVATVGKGDRCIGLRTELDALPVTENTGLEFSSVNDGVMHACGHDVHLASVVATMLTLKKHEEILPFAVKAFLQPAEESLGGAENMIRLGCLEDPKADEVYGFHVDPTVEVGKIMLMPGVMNAAVLNFEITILGTSCHGAHPEQGVDAIVISSAVISALQSISSRSFSPTTPVILTIGTISGGVAMNVVCGEVKMTGTLRALSSEVIGRLGQKLCDITVNVARSLGGDAVVEFSEGYPELSNNEELTEDLIIKCREVFGNDNVLRMKEPSLGADDFAYFTNAVPGCYFNVGCRSKDQGTDQALHSPVFSPDEGCMKSAYKAFLMALCK